MFSFQDVLEKAGIAPDQVNVILHSPRERELLTLMPSLVRTRRSAVEAYQATHSAPAERVLAQGRPYVASFVKTGAAGQAGRSEMLFIGLYRNAGRRLRSHAEILADPDVRWLKETFGCFDRFDGADAEATHAWFGLEQQDLLAELQGRLLVSVRLTQSYIRLAENLDAPVLAIHRQGVFDAPPPGWRKMAVRAPLIRDIPAGWAERLREWRGVYLIVDESDGARYVGSAYGMENLLGRWRAHVAGEAGVTVELAARNPVNFRFSILERVSPDMRAEDVIALEQTWMDRLHSRRYGLNA